MENPRREAASVPRGRRCRDDGSITRCIDLLKQGNRDAAQLLWQRDFHGLVGLARAGSAARRGGPSGVHAGLALSDLDGLGVEGIVGQPGPEPAAQVAEECRRLLDLLTDELLRRAARWQLASFTNGEISAKLPCVESTMAQVAAAAGSGSGSWGHERAA